MIDSLSLVKLCQAIYKPAGEFSSIIQACDSVYAGVTSIGGVKVICCRGSVDTTDWVHDFEAYPLEVPGVGTVHGGMWFGIERFMSQLGLARGAVVAFTGHSLGCAHAAFAARLALDCGASVTQLELFAPPRCGDAVFHAGVSSIPTRAWRNGFDPVTEVPILKPWEQFSITSIYNEPEHPWDLMQWHSIDLYAKGMENA